MRSLFLFGLLAAQILGRIPSGMFRAAV